MLDRILSKKSNCSIDFVTAVSATFCHISTAPTTDQLCIEELRGDFGVCGPPDRLGDKIDAQDAWKLKSRRAQAYYVGSSEKPLQDS